MTQKPRYHFLIPCQITFVTEFVKMYLIDTHKMAILKLYKFLLFAPSYLKCFMIKDTSFGYILRQRETSSVLGVSLQFLR